MNKKELTRIVIITGILAVPPYEKLDERKGFYDSEHMHDTYANYAFDLSTRNMITPTVTTSLPFQGTANITLKSK